MPMHLESPEPHGILLFYYKLTISAMPATVGFRLH